MNENQSRIKNYILIVKTLHGDPEEYITVIIKGVNGQTERRSLGKSQAYDKAFKDNQTDLFSLLSNIDVGEIFQVEFYADKNAKFKQWKFSNIFIIDGIRVYRNRTLEHVLLPSIDIPFVVNVVEPSIESQESIYYAFIKTGNDSCSEDCYPKLSLYGNNQQHTEIDMKSSYRTHSSSINNNLALEKYQFDIFQWQDSNLGPIERIRLQLYSENKSTKSQWPIEWLLVIHNGYSFTGRIMLNRILKMNRMINIDLEKNILPISTGEYGDSFDIQNKYEGDITSSNILNKQSNATTDDIGRYYVIIRNLEGTNGDVHMDFHGDRVSSSGEQHLLKSENYPDHPFATKHTDLFHIKALEVGHIHSVSIRLDQTDKEHSLTLDSLYLIHNAIVYQFDLRYIILNKEQPKKEFLPQSHEIDKTCYYIATHTADKMLSGTNACFKVVVAGTKGMFGPIELKESLTNGNNPFEKECIDLFHIEDNDIGDPLSITISLEPKGLMPHLFSTAKCERIMIIKNGDYNSLWQLVGDLKSKEPKIISLPPRQRQSMRDSIVPVEAVHLKTTDESNSPKIKTPEHTDTTESLITNLPNSLSGDYYQDNLTMAAIEDHQKRHTFAPNLQQAQQNYRELRRLLKKMNDPVSKENRTQKIKRIS